MGGSGHLRLVLAGDSDLGLGVGLDPGDPQRTACLSTEHFLVKVHAQRSYEGNGSREHRERSVTRRAPTT